MKTPTVTFVIQLLLGLILGLGSSLRAEEQSAPEKISDIRVLLELTGSAKLAKQVFDQMLVGFKQSSGDVPNSFWEEFSKEFTPNELIDLIVPVYDKHLSHDDIKGLISFYRSPTGERFVAAQPMIVQGSMAAGQKWGEAIAAKIIQRLEAERERSTKTGAEVP